MTSVLLLLVASLGLLSKGKVFEMFWVYDNIKNTAPHRIVPENGIISFRKNRKKQNV